MLDVLELLFELGEVLFDTTHYVTKRLPEQRSTRELPAEADCITRTDTTMRKRTTLAYPPDVPGSPALSVLRSSSYNCEH